MTGELSIPSEPAASVADGSRLPRSGAGRRLRILCVTSIFPNRSQPNKGIYNWKHVLHLQKQADVRVISPVPWLADWQSRIAGHGRLSNPERQQWQGADVAYPAYYYTPGFLRGTYGALLKSSIQRLFHSMVAEFQPDIVYACWAYPDGFAAWKLAREAKLPVAVKVHGSDLLLLEGSPSRKRRTIELLQDVDAISAVSADLRNCAVRLGTPPDRAHLIYEGTDRDLFCLGDQPTARRDLGLDPQRPRLLFVGNLLPVKNLPNLIEACRRVFGRGLAFEVDIIGEGPLAATLASQLADLGLSDRIYLRGRILQANLPRWYQAADAVVLTSHSEGVPNVLTEAAACGTPFISTDVGGISEIANLSPIGLVPANNSEALSLAIEGVLRDPARAKAGVRVAAVPTVENCASETLDLFSRLVSYTSRL